MKSIDRRTFLKAVGIGAVGTFLGTHDYDSMLGGGQNDTWGGKHERRHQGWQGSDKSQMIYRTIPHSGQRISVISLGVGSLHESEDTEITRIVDTALSSGINLMDMIMPTKGPMEAIARGLKPHRKDTSLQLHIGSYYNMAGVTDRTRDLSETKKSFENDLRVYGEGDNDIGMIHYVDQADDYDNMLNNGLLDYAVRLKEAGKIRYIGFSSHSVEMCNRFLDTGLIDVFMFSLNPAYDFESTPNGLRVSEDRAALYAKAQKLGAAITVMKCYNGGKLLSAGDSPFGKAMSTAQCVQYCLDWPAVASCVIGVKDMNELKASFAYLSATEEQRQYQSVLSSGTAVTEGSCIYCNHCLPCPVSINIGDVYKYYDLAQHGDQLARDHYASLNRHASDCIHCGECEPRCPFHVKIMDGMDKIAAAMGR